MSISALAWALEQRVGNPLAKFLLLLLADNAGAEDEARVRPDDIAAVSEMSPCQVREALAFLREGGFISFISPERCQLSIPREIGPVVSHKARVLSKKRSLRCEYCGDERGPFEADHIIPRSRGGRGGAQNLAIACFACNRAKGARTPEEWRS